MTKTNKSKCPVCSKLTAIDKRGRFNCHGYREIRRGRTNTIQTQRACAASNAWADMDRETILAWDASKTRIVCEAIWRVCVIGSF
jgi:hypothetical protein